MLFGIDCACGMQCNYRTRRQTRCSYPATRPHDRSRAARDLHRMAAPIPQDAPAHPLDHSKLLATIERVGDRVTALPIRWTLATSSSQTLNAFPFGIKGLLRSGRVRLANLHSPSSLTGAYLKSCHPLAARRLVTRARHAASSCRGSIARVAPILGPFPHPRHPCRAGYRVTFVRKTRYFWTRTRTLFASLLALYG